MVWISFAVGAFLGAMIGMMVMALAVAAGRISEDGRVADAYRDGRQHERQALGLSSRVDPRRPEVKH